MPQERRILPALLSAVLLAALLAGCAPARVAPAPGPSPSPAPGPAAKPPLPALAQLEINLDGKPQRLDLVRSGPGQFALETLRLSGSTWAVAARGTSVAVKQGVGRYILEHRDLPGHPGSIVAGQAPAVFAFDPATLSPLDVAELLAPPAPGDGTQIVIDKGTNTLYLFKNRRLAKHYPVATGRDYNGPQPTWADYRDNYVTPVGSFSITQRVVNPVYTSFHTGQTWKGGDPDNPLGTRWLGFPVLSAQGKQKDVGLIWAIHGTNEPDKIGTYVSDGCIRMQVPDVEELFEQVPAGTHLTIIDSFPVAG